MYNVSMFKGGLNKDRFHEEIENILTAFACGVGYDD